MNTKSSSLFVVLLFSLVSAYASAGCRTTYVRLNATQLRTEFGINLVADFSENPANEIATNRIIPVDSCSREGQTITVESNNFPTELPVFVRKEAVEYIDMNSGEIVNDVIFLDGSFRCINSKTLNTRTSAVYKKVCR